MNEPSRLDSHDLLNALQNTSARRGQTVLKLIYAKAWELSKLRSVNQTPLSHGDGLSDTRNLAFLSAVATGVRHQSTPSVFDLERFSQDWADLVPRSPEIRADIARRLAQAYAFEERFVPGIIDALTLNDPAVIAAFRSLFACDLVTIYATSTSVKDRVKWMNSSIAGWFDALPAFWASLALTISSTLGPGILYFPFLLYGFGPEIASGIILLIGGLNVLTLAFLAEAQLRSLPSLRQFGFDRIIAHYLGPAASLFLQASLFIYCVMVLFVYTGGFLEALGDALGPAASIAFVPLLAFILWYLSPRKRSGTLALSLLIALVNLTILVGFGMIFTVELLFASPGATKAEVAVVQVPWQISIGAVLYGFAGQISVSNGARLILRHDGTHAGFFMGAVAGLSIITLIYAGWTWTVVSAISRGVLGDATSVLSAVSSQYGYFATAAGVAFVVLSLGIGASNYALSVFHGVSNWVDQRHNQTERKLGQVFGLIGISIVMFLAFFVFWNGAFDLSRYFGLVGGLVAPIVAGVFPVLILLVCRRRGMMPVTRTPNFLSHWVIASVVLVLFLSVYPVQAFSAEYDLWYSLTSLSILIIVTCLVLHLLLRGTFEEGLLLRATKNKDGWVPQRWKLYAGGMPVNDPVFFWKTRTNGDFEAVDETTSPARTLIALRFPASEASGGDLDVDLEDEAAGRSLEFEILNSDVQMHEIVLK